MPAGIAHGLQFGVPASFLFDEVIFDSDDAFRGPENALPIRHALAEQNLVAFVGIARPVFTMDGPNASRVGWNPGHTIAARFEASGHVKLQHHGRLGVGGQNLYGTANLEFLPVASCCS